MSLLMDALKKAEREKNRAASKKSAEDNSGNSETGELSADHSENEAVDQAQSTQSNRDATDTSPEQKDESWAFDTGELELEPLVAQQKQELADVQQDTQEEQSFGLDDTTIIEPIPEGSAFIEENDLTITSDPALQQSDFDHDATLPSERAIQTSLKDYFEASQSITMDQSSVSAAIAPDVTEHSVTNTSPLDISATHVTAHTIFTAGRGRQASTGLVKYALFGTLFLAMGLGAVALYYSYVTPSMIDMPPTLPTVVKMVEPGDQLQTVEVDVNTAKGELPFEPGTSLTVEREDPVLAEVVKEIPVVETIQQSESEPAVTFMDKKEELQPSTPVVETVTTERTVSTASKEVQVPVAAAVAQTGNNPPRYEKFDHDVLYFDQKPAKPEPEEAIIRNDKQYLTTTLEGGYQLGEQGFVSGQPIDVVSVEDFSEDLQMPKSAIKITRGRTHRARSSDLNTAYQAYQSGDYLNAKFMYRKVLGSRPDNRDARLGVAAIAVMEGKYETAYKHYLHLLQLNPKDQVVNAALFNLQGNTSGTVNESQLKLLLDQNPDSPPLYFSLGSYYAGQVRWPEAQQAFFEAYSGDSNNADYAYNLAVSLDQMGQAKSALSYYRTALKLADQAPVSFNTSRVLNRIQKLSGIFSN